MSEPGRGRVVAVVGPTATGKSELAIELAERLDAEIVNADSMQLYEGMDVGTAKVTPAQRRDVPHHLLDIWPITKSAAVAEYQSMARTEIGDIHGRGRLPLLVGGSGLYVRAAIDRLDFPGESPAIRTRLLGELHELGPRTLHARLAELDAEAAAHILTTNGRRIVRALEVIEITGGPFTARMPGFDAIYDVVQIGLERTDLDDRVARRVDRMMGGGLLEEVRRLLPDGLRASPTAGKALGYAQLLAVMDDGGHIVGDLDEAVATTVRATRRFVRRQRSWFRRDPRVRWIDAAAPDAIERALAAITPTLEA
ncbi:MAG: tRNA (adenosine(37)-N6)-dimethylallyltransferase MiaA [Actinobacteria bacterium]|nr:tRNA (adenosine(37)-N6)-dimethylallyltransferase MiaA [Actinomycetota bacterium]